MRISSIPPNQDSIKDAAISWLRTVLDHPRLATTSCSLPDGVHGYIYIDGYPRVIASGTWQIADSAIYLPRTGGDIAVPLLTRLQILGAIASLTGATEDPTIVEKITTRLVTIMREETIGLYHSIVKATHRPSRLALDQEGFRVAAEMNGVWYLPSGAPVEVNDRWITMDF